MAYRIPDMDRPQEAMLDPDGLNPKERACYQMIFENLSVEDRAILTKVIVRTPEILDQVMESRKRQAISAVADSFSRFSTVIDLPILEIAKLLALPPRELQETANIVSHLRSLGVQFNEQDLREVIDLAHVTAVMEPMNEKDSRIERLRNRTITFGSASKPLR